MTAFAEWRSTTPLTQKQVSDCFDIPIRTLQDWEQGKRNPPEYVLKMIKRIYEIDYIEKGIHHKVHLHE